MLEESETPAPQREATTRASIRVALLMFGFAILCPVIGVVSTLDSHDGFEIFGTFVIMLGVGGIALLIGIICTVAGFGSEPRSNATMWAGTLSVIAVLLLLFFLGRAM
jgi:hypothetical protein